MLDNVSGSWMLIKNQSRYKTVIGQYKYHQPLLSSFFCTFSLLAINIFNIKINKLYF